MGTQHGNIASAECHQPDGRVHLAAHNGTYGRGCEFCSQRTLCQADKQANPTATAGKPLGLSFRHALVAQGIEHRFPKPLGPSAVP
jgi:hypothetical protein